MRDVRPFTVFDKGQARTFDRPGWCCDASEGSIFARADRKVSDRELAILKAEVDNLAGPEEVERVRKGLGLTQAGASEIFGGGPRRLAPSRSTRAARCLPAA